MLGSLGSVVMVNMSLNFEREFVEVMEGVLFFLFRRCEASLFQLHLLMMTISSRHACVQFSYDQLCRLINYLNVFCTVSGIV